MVLKLSPCPQMHWSKTFYILAAKKVQDHEVYIQTHGRGGDTRLGKEVTYIPIKCTVYSNFLLRILLWDCLTEK